MFKGVRSALVVFFALLLCGGVFGQTRRFNEAYNPLHVAKRLSYENFRDLKMLQTAILNFGGGKDEVDRLIDQYAEASALYFQSRYEESANLFSDNQREILISAKRLTTKYKDTSEKLLLDTTKKTIKDELESALKKGKKEENYTELFLNRARFAVNTANDYYDRYKDATTASPMNFIKAIFYYRQAKENMFELFKTIEMDKEKRDGILEQYKRDIFDNENKVYQSKEKNP
ncbi:MAG: hypothetical protein JXA20_02750 [Spirochaetes bacterium]|nr:hypothetical protein [Spirochaetota bacterium]